MKRLHRPLFTLLLALLLLGSQQAALAHLIGHASVAAESAAAPEDSGHGAALTLSHVCTTCIAFAAMAGGPPSLDSTPVFAEARGAAVRVVHSSACPGRSVPVRRARGPPPLQTL